MYVGAALPPLEKCEIDMNVAVHRICFADKQVPAGVGSDTTLATLKYMAFVLLETIQENC